MAGENLTVPLNDLWASKFGLGPVTTTLVFIAYVIGVVGMLLVAGSLSEAIGRRPVLALALTLTAVSTLGFALANGLTVLLVAGPQRRGNRSHHRDGDVVDRGDCARPQDRSGAGHRRQRRRPESTWPPSARASAPCSSAHCWPRSSRRRGSCGGAPGQACWQSG
ncbi:MFS transporter [Streptomyces sp. NRRL S-813]|uniref:MFS transporter n=1 Tax=Streptomyces sp. NRRL S-813 TaxID=1463919 RepID=UPI001901D869|nr:MFS transporter [Streptomyces sp. NRRL S-813]